MKGQALLKPNHFVNVKNNKYRILYVVGYGFSTFRSEQFPLDTMKFDICGNLREKSENE